MSESQNQMNVSSSATAGQGGKKLLDRALDGLLAAGFEDATARRFVGWMRQFILFHGKKHPLEMGYSEIDCFLKGEHFQGANGGPQRVEATRALEFLYVHVLDRLWPKELGRGRPVRPREKRAVSVSLEATERGPAREGGGYPAAAPRARQFVGEGGPAGGA
jgi:hypothetical protein